MFYDDYGRVFLTREGLAQIESPSGAILGVTTDRSVDMKSYVDAFGNEYRMEYITGGQVAYDAGADRTNRVEWSDPAMAADDPVKIFTYVLKRFDNQNRATAEMQMTFGDVDAVWDDTRSSFVDAGSGEIIPTKLFHYDRDDRLAAVDLPAVNNPNTGSAERPRYEYAYDERGQQTLIRDPGGVETILQYDDRGWQTSRTLPLGFGDDGVASLEELNRLMERPADTSFTERMEYDDRGRRTLHVTFEGVVAENLYDDYGRMWAVNFYSDVDDFDAGLVSQRDEHRYDERGRPDGWVRYQTLTPTAIGEEVSARDVSAFEVLRREATAFDDRDRIVAQISDEGVVSYDFDPLGRIDSVTVHAGDDTDSPADRVTFHGYDAAGRLAEVIEDETPDDSTDDPQVTATYQFDVRSQLDSMTVTDGVDADNDGSPDGRSVTTTYDADVLGRVETQVDIDEDGNELARYDYDIRADGRRTGLTETFWTDVNENGNIDPGEQQTTTRSMEFDDGDRLIRESVDHFDDSLDRTESFTYDLSGNRTSRLIDHAAADSADEFFTYQYDANDRLLYAWADADADGTIDSTTVFDYDHTQQIAETVYEGLVDDATTSLPQVGSVKSMTYNLQGRLASVTQETYDDGALQSRTRTRYEYDGESFRVGIVSEVDANLDGTFTVQSEVEFLTDRHGAIGYTQAIRETKTENGNVLVTDYTYGMDEIAQRVHGVNAEGNAVDDRHVFGHDSLGSVRVLYDLQKVIGGVLDEIISYSSYGEVIGVHDAAGSLVGTDQASSSTNLGFTGERYDAAFGGSYLRDRYMDSATGRFNRLDAFFGNLSDPQSFNKYTYGHNDPVNNTDPTGLFSLGGMIGSIGIAMGNMSMSGAASYAAKQFAISVIETTVEVLIVNLIAVFTGVKPDHGWGEIARNLGTNYLSNLVTAGIGNKGKKAIAVRNLMDFAIRMVSDVFIAKQDPMWAAALNLAGMASSGLFLLSKYGKKLFGECIGRFGGCFDSDTPVVTGSLPEPLFEKTNSDTADLFGSLTANQSAIATLPISKVKLGSRVLTEVPSHFPRDNEFGPPDEFTWRRIDLLQWRPDGTRIEMELIRPQWWINLLGLSAGTVIELPFSELQTHGFARVTSIGGSIRISGGEGEIVIGRFLTRMAENLLRITLEDGSSFVSTDNHLIWSADESCWKEAEQLIGGERLSALDGECRVAKVERALRPADVFNLEVNSDHVYRILDHGILVHNSRYGFMDMEHIFKGSRGGGFHHHIGEVAGTAKRVGQKFDMDPSWPGAYKSHVDVLDDSGNFVPKTSYSGNRQFSTFFPETWSVTKTAQEIEHAFANRMQVSGAKYIGTSTEGYPIRLIVKNNRVVTAHPEL